jgi:hypothetical protein
LGRVGTALEVDVLARKQLRGGSGRIKPQEARPELDRLTTDENNGWIGGHWRQRPKNPEHLVGAEGRRRRQTT